MAENINDLIERCDAQAQILIADAEETFGQVDEIVELVTTFVDNLTSLDEETQATWSEIITALEEAEAELETELENTKEKFGEFQ
jgi:methyl-accepting chemotaxis protein